ncbi:hypothetical protein [Nocardia sp. CA-120079]|uniref:hypothetical protein n=1 Tax=Nocardia sp. CA-120079 TaxID=3239974 RepID=UPI003D95FE4C
MAPKQPASGDVSARKAARLRATQATKAAAAVLAANQTDLADFFARRASAAERLATATKRREDAIAAANARRDRAIAAAHSGYERATAKALARQGAALLRIKRRGATETDLLRLTESEGLTSGELRKMLAAAEQLSAADASAVETVAETGESAESAEVESTGGDAAWEALGGGEPTESVSVGS